LDDDFDTDFGFSGKLQFCLGQRFPTIADISGSNGFESDNDASGSDKTPQTSAIFVNMTMLGPLSSATAANINANFTHAAQIRRNSALSVFNSIFAGYVEGIYIDDSKVTTPASTSTNYTAGRLAFQDNIVYGSNKKGTEVKGENKTLFETALRAANVFNAGLYADALINSPFKYSSDFANAGTPDFTVKAASIAATGAVYTNAKIATDPFFEKVAYRGAFGSTDWTTGWANFDPQKTPYTTPGVVK
jgi:hypothetical protein